jgi:hypothetical protein
MVKEAPFSPSDVGDLDMSFIDAQSFITSPPNPNIASTTVFSKFNPSSVALSSKSMTDSPAVAAFINTPFKHARQHPIQTPMTASAHPAILKTPSLPKTAIPTLKEQERVSIFYLQHFIHAYRCSTMFKRKILV